MLTFVQEHLGIFLPAMNACSVFPWWYWCRAGKPKKIVRTIAKR